MERKVLVDTRLCNVGLKHQLREEKKEGTREKEDDNKVIGGPKLLLFEHRRVLVSEKIKKTFSAYLKKTNLFPKRKHHSIIIRWR